MARYSDEDITNTALKAMAEAGKNYCTWTNDYVAPWKAPEYIFTTAIAQKIAARPFSHGVYCEFNSKEAMYWANKRKFGRNLSKLTDGSRTDILVTTKADDTFRQIIEVKRRVWTSAQIKVDVNRICDVLGPRGNSTIKSGLSIFLLCYEGDTEKEAKENLSKAVEANRLSKFQRDKAESKNRRDYWLIDGGEEAVKFRKLKFKFELVHSTKPRVWKDSDNKYWAWNPYGLLLTPTKAEKSK